MKNTLRTGVFVSALFFASNSYAQMQVDKPLQMTGSTNSDKRITGVGNPGASDHAVNVGNIQTGSLIYAPSTGSGGDYMVSLTPMPTAFPAGMVINFIANHPNSGAATLNINGLSALPLLKNGSSALVAGDIVSGQAVSAMYDGTNYQLISPPSTVSGSSGNYIQNQTSTDQSAGFRISGNGIFNGGNVGIGTASPSAKLQVLGNILLGGSEDAATALYSISPLSGSGAFNGGNGRELLIEAGISDNAPGKRGGHLYLRPGAPTSPATQFGYVVIADQGGSVGIGNAAPTSKLDVTDGALSLSGSQGVSHGIRFDRGPALATGGAVQATIFNELNGAAGTSEALTFRADNYKFQNYDGTDELIFRNGLIGVRTMNPQYFIQVGDHTAGDNTNYSIGVRRHGTSTNMGTYSGNSPCIEINDFSDDGPASPENMGLLYIVTGRIADVDPNAGNANMLSIVNDNGHAMVVKANRRVGVRTNTPGTAFDVVGVSQATSFNATSDARFKKNITPLDNALEKIGQLQGVSYDWKKEEFPEFYFDDKRQIGFLAQEVEKIIPEAVNIDANGKYGINYSAIVPVLAEAMKTQQQQIDKLTEQNKDLLERLEKLEK